MNESNFKKLPRKAVEICSLNIVEIEFLNCDYKLKLFNNNLVNRQNGYLEVGELISGGNAFKFRWDERAGLIDVDVKLPDADKKIKEFLGHHTEQISDSPNRKYRFQICLPNKELIFKAIVEITIKTENRIEKSLQYVIKGEK